MSEPRGHQGHSSHGIDFNDQFDHWLFRVVVVAAVIAFLSRGLNVL